MAAIIRGMTSTITTAMVPRITMAVIPITMVTVPHTTMVVIPTVATTMTTIYIDHEHIDHKRATTALTLID